MACERRAEKRLKRKGRREGAFDEGGLQLIFLGI